LIGVPVVPEHFKLFKMRINTAEIIACSRISWLVNIRYASVKLERIRCWVSVRTQTDVIDRYERLVRFCFEEGESWQ